MKCVKNILHQSLIWLIILSIVVVFFGCQKNTDSESKGMNDAGNDIEKTSSTESSSVEKEISTQNLSTSMGDLDALVSEIDLSSLPLSPIWWASLFPEKNSSDNVSNKVKYAAYRKDLTPASSITVDVMGYGGTLAYKSSSVDTVECAWLHHYTGYDGEGRLVSVDISERTGDIYSISIRPNSSSHKDLVYSAATEQKLLDTFKDYLREKGVVLEEFVITVITDWDVTKSYYSFNAQKYIAGVATSERYGISFLPDGQLLCLVQQGIGQFENVALPEGIEERVTTLVTPTFETMKQFLPQKGGTDFDAQCSKMELVRLWDNQLALKVRFKITVMLPYTDEEGDADSMQLNSTGIQFYIQAGG